MNQYLDDPNYPSITAAPVKNQTLKMFSDLLRSGRDFGNKATVPSWVPLIGDEGVGDLLVGQSPEEVEQWSYGNLPFNSSEDRKGTGSLIPNLKSNRRESFADAALLGMEALPGASALSKATHGMPVGLSTKSVTGLPPPENAARTQIKGTVPTYQKAAGVLSDVDGDVIDFGAGLGEGAKAMEKVLGRKVDTYEPFAQGWSPRYSSLDASDVPSDAYAGLTNLNVLNVVPREMRDDITKNIARVLRDGGKGVITTRGKDVLDAKGVPGSEPMSIITSRDTYQKGFTNPELQEYLKYMLGDKFDVNPLKLGAAGAMIEKRPGLSVMVPSNYQSAISSSLRDTPGKVKDLSLVPGVEPDMARSMESAYKKNGFVPADALASAIKKREGIRSQSPVAGKPFHEMTDQEIEAFGKQHGVDFTINPMVDVVDPETGKSWQIPGGLDGNFSYTDLHRLKALAYNPNDMSDAFHAQLQKKMVGAAVPKDLDNFELFNRTAFGITSPNTPLLPNQFMIAALRARDEGDLKKLASYVGDDPSSLKPTDRRLLDKKIGNDYNIGAANTGGMAFRSSADLTNVSELAKQMQEFPDFYRKKPEESWQEGTERISNVTRGLSAKTGSFGTVWQNPLEATTSAMDRHMARNFYEQAKNDPDISARWAEMHPNLWNQQIDSRAELAKQLKAGAISKDDYADKVAGLPPEGSKKAKSMKDLEKMKGFQDWQIGRVEQEVAQHGGGKYRLKTGEINPRVPAHLRNLPKEPDSFFTFGDLYTTMLRANKESANKHGLEVYPEQWRIWDRKRGQLEPHESMYPGLHKLPRMSENELLNAYEVQKEAGFGGNGRTKPYDWKRGLYFSGVPMTGVGLDEAFSVEDKK